MTIGEVLDMAKANGYKVWRISGHDWAWLITPKGNVMCISEADFGNGFHFTLQYVPNKNCGSGCSCHEYGGDGEWDFGLVRVTVKGLEELEADGLRFARELGAPLYYSPDAFLQEQRRFWKEKLVEG